MIRLTSIDDEIDTENFHINEINISKDTNDIDKDNNDNNNDNDKDNVNNINNVSREREIFLRAALQLLDRKEYNNYYDVPRTNDKYNSNSNNNNTRDRSESSTAYLQCISSNIIKCGRLKKASRGGTFSGTTTWKVKYIEISHGIFSYEDDNYGFIDNWSSGSFDNKRIQKSIPLNIDTCRCRPYKTNYGHNDMLELHVAGGPRRIWQTSSEQDRDEWINAIKNAMIGSAGDFVGQNIGQPAVIINEPLKRSITKSFMSPLSKNSHCEFGFTEQYARGLTIFKNIRNVAHNSSSVKEYKEMLESLIRDKTKIIVPVSFIKMTLPNNVFGETSTIQNLGKSVDSSQVWKDLQRDSIKVNGDIISGEHGPEAMIGAIVRHIFDKVQTIRSKISASLCNGTMHSLHSAKNDYEFDLTEAQVMSCARDLLILCNRTQSGGDTYFCVDSLLCNRDKELCILTPLASESDPLEIFVDIVQGTSHPVNSPSKGNDESSYDSNFVDDDSTGVTSTSTSGAEILSISTGDVVKALISESVVKTVSNSDKVLSESNHSKLSDKNDLSSKTDAVPPEGIETRRKAQLSLNLDEKDGITLSSSSPVKFIRKSLDESVKKEVLILDSEKKVKKWDDVSIISDITMDSTSGKTALRSRRHSDPINTMLVTGKLKPASQINNNYTEGTIIKHDHVSKSDKGNKHLPKPVKEQEKQSKTPSKGGGFLAMLTPVRLKKESSTIFEDNHSPEETPRMCIRIQVKAISKYRICDFNPQDESNDTWGVAIGVFEQCFFLKSNCNGRPSMSDRMVTISMMKQQ